LTVVVFDSAFLILALSEHAKVPADPVTKKPIPKGRERVEHLIDMLSETRTRMLIPSPVLAEVLVQGGAAATQQLIAKLRSVSMMQVADFDTLAAIECAQLTGAALASGPKRGPARQEPWQKVKIDRQIVAIAKVRQANVVFTCDAGLAALANAEGLLAQHVADLPVPPMKEQVDLFKPPSSPAPDKEG
jgi:hypothetical protein